MAYLGVCWSFGSTVSKHGNAHEVRLFDLLYILRRSDGVFEIQYYSSDAEQ